MTYTQAKLAAIDHTITDPNVLVKAASLLLANLAATDEDVNDAVELSCRAKRLQQRPA